MPATCASTTRQLDAVQRALSATVAPPIHSRNLPHVLDSDALTCFLLPEAGVRGVHVQLGETWRQIEGRGEYPPPSANCWARRWSPRPCSPATPRSTGACRCNHGGRRAAHLFAECTATGTLRGIARLADDVPLPAGRDLRDLAPGAILAITIENPSLSGDDPIRYQGLVPLEADALSGAFEDYFRQSEQLPTRVLLAAGPGRVSGLMLQKLPGDAGDQDGWTRASALFDTLGPAELLELPVETLLHRLFHEDRPQRLGDRPLRFACSCSRERVAAMLQSLGEDEARAAVIDGAARIQCEFCAQRYAFEPAAVAALFPVPDPTIEAPGRLQ